MLESPAFYSQPARSAIIGRGNESEPTPEIVLDTNIVFDLLLFGDPACVPLRAAIEHRRLRWVATGAMFDECFHVVARGGLNAWSPDEALLRAAWGTHCTLIAPSPAAGSTGAPRSSDADDQMFVDLAVARRVPWLFSKDRAVLRLAARLARFGVAPLTPAAWARGESATANIG